VYRERSKAKTIQFRFNCQRLNVTLNCFLGFQTITCNINHSGFIRVYLACFYQFFQHCSCRTASCFSEDAFGFRQQLNAINDFCISYRFNVAAGFPSCLKGIDPITWVATIDLAIVFGLTGVTKSRPSRKA